jgi:hypothetical protein
VHRVAEQLKNTEADDRCGVDAIQQGRRRTIGLLNGEPRVADRHAVAQRIEDRGPALDFDAAHGEPEPFVECGDGPLLLQPADDRVPTLCGRVIVGQPLEPCGRVAGPSGAPQLLLDRRRNEQRPPHHECAAEQDQQRQGRDRGRPLHVGVVPRQDDTRADAQEHAGQAERQEAIDQAPRDRDVGFPE